MRWRPKLSGFNYEVIYHQGLALQVPDFLPRLLQPSHTSISDPNNRYIPTFEPSPAPQSLMLEKGVGFSFNILLTKPVLQLTRSHPLRDAAPTNSNYLEENLDGYFFLDNHLSNTEFSKLEVRPIVCLLSAMELPRSRTMIISVNIY